MMSCTREQGQKTSFACTHMLRIPLSVKSRFRKLTWRRAEDTSGRHIQVLRMVEGV